MEFTWVQWSRISNRVKGMGGRARKIHVGQPEAHQNVLNVLEKITHMWTKSGTPQNFFWAFIDELEKQIIIRKTVEIILVYTMLHF